MNKKLFVFGALGVVVLASLLVFVVKKDSFTSLSEQSIGQESHAAEVRQVDTYTQEAKRATDAQLVAVLKQGLTKLTTGTYDTALGFQMSAYMHEYNVRTLTDSTVNGFEDAMLQKYGPCWGIPEGDCRE